MDLKRIVIFTLVILFALSLTTNVAHGVVVIRPCNTSDDCMKELKMCPETPPPHCNCKIPCTNGRCGVMGTFSSNLSDDYFIEKANEYIISKVGEDFYKEHYQFYKIQRGIYYDTNVKVLYTLSIEGYNLPARGIIFSCSGKITLVKLYVNNSSNVINKSKAVEIANSFLIQNNITPPKKYDIYFEYVYGKPELNWRIHYLHPSYWISIDYNTGKIVSETVTSSRPSKGTIMGTSVTFSIFIGGILITYFIALRKLNKRDKIIGLSMVASVLWYMFSYTFIAPFVFKIISNDPNVVLSVPQPFIMVLLTVYLPVGVFIATLLALVYYHKDDIKRGESPSVLWYLVPITVALALLADSNNIWQGMPSLINYLSNVLIHYEGGCWSMFESIFESTLITWIVIPISINIAYTFRENYKFARNIILAGVILAVITCIPSIYAIRINAVIILLSIIVAMYNKWFFKGRKIIITIAIFIAAAVITKFLWGLMQPLCIYIP